MHSVQPNLMLTVLAGKQLQTAKRTPRATLSGELLLRDVEFLGVRVNSDDFGAVDCLTALNHRQTHGSKAKNDRGGEGFNLKFGYAKMRSAGSCWIDRFGSSTSLRAIPDGAQSSSNATTKQAHPQLMACTCSRPSVAPVQSHLKYLKSSAFQELLQVSLRIDLRAGNFGEHGVLCEPQCSKKNWKPEARGLSLNLNLQWNGQKNS